MHVKRRKILSVLTGIFVIAGAISPTMAVTFGKQQTDSPNLWILHTDEDFRNAVLSHIDLQTGTPLEQILFPEEKPILPFIRWSPQGDYLAALQGESTEYRTLSSETLCVYDFSGEQIFCGNFPIASQPMSLAGGFQPIPPRWSEDGDFIYVVSAVLPTEENPLTVLEIDRGTGESVDAHPLSFTQAKLSRWLWHSTLSNIAVVQKWDVSRTVTSWGETSVHILDLVDNQTHQIMSGSYIQSEIVNNELIFSELGNFEQIYLINLNGNTQEIDLPLLPETQRWGIGDAVLSNKQQFVAINTRWLELSNEQDIRLALLLVNLETGDWRLIEKSGQRIDNISFSPDDVYLSARICDTFFDDSCYLLVFSLIENIKLEMDLTIPENAVLKQVIWN